jgi:hypothetical protein
MPTRHVPGSIDDRVRLKLGGEEIFLAEQWVVNEGVMQTPSRFSLQLGQSTPLAGLFTQDPQVSDETGKQFTGPRWPLGSPFEMYIGDDLQMSGIYEGFLVHGPTARIALKGRDALSALMRTHPEAEQSFIDGTYLDLVRYALTAAGLTDATVTASNAANRKVKAGIPIDVIEEPTTVDALNADGSAAAGNQTSGTVVGAIVSRTHQNSIHENLLTFVRRHLDRVGLFLWAGAQKDTFILGQPNGAQDPCMRITRRRGQGRLESSNIRDVSFSNDVSQRHGTYTVFGRGGGGKAGRCKAISSSTDEEMVNLGLATGANFGAQGICYRDVNVQNREQAEFFSRRKAAEERRNGWNLTYTISGCRLPPLSGSKWGVVTPDTVVAIDDDEIGIHGNYYVESVERRRNPQTETEIRFMRTTDLIFGTGGIE